MTKKKNKKGFLTPSKRYIISALLFITTIIISLSFFDLAGVGGAAILKALLFLFGETAFLVPLIVLIIGFLLIYNNLEEDHWGKFFSCLLVVIISLAALCSILAYHQGLNIITAGALPGGWIGKLASWPLLRLFGFWVSLIFFLGIIIVAGVISLHPWIEKHKKALSSQKEKSKNRIKSVAKKVKKKTKDSVKKIKKKTAAPKVNWPDAEEEKKKKKKKKKSKKGKEKSKSSSNSDYNAPPLKLLQKEKGKPDTGDIQKKSAIIKDTLEHFGVSVEMSEINVGPTVTQYTLKPSEGIKLSRITSLTKNLSLALAAHPIRVEAPIPGRSLVGVEVPNENRILVRLRNLVSRSDFSEDEDALTVCLGKDVAGKPVFANLDKMPHLLVAGATGSGKTVGLNDLIVSLLYGKSPQELRLVLIDPKHVEFSLYEGIPHLLGPIISDAEKAVAALEWLTEKVEERFSEISKYQVRDIQGYNEVARNDPSVPKMPYVVVVVDELSDLMSTRGKELESSIVRLAQKARAVGIHLILATQRPSVEVITGLIKANITCRISFQVASQVDSRTIIDMAGAERLLGNGDMLFVSPQNSKPQRIQGAFVSEKEVTKIVNYINKNNKSPETATNLNEDLEKAIQQDLYEETYIKKDDPLYDKAKFIIVNAEKGSASLLQRKLSIGYARAARLLDMLESENIVGPPRGTKAREVLVSAQELREQEEGEDEEDTEEENE